VNCALLPLPIRALGAAPFHYPTEFKNLRMHAQTSLDAPQTDGGFFNSYDVNLLFS
jgi:hypothetical protein